jgi:hypothetical protein
MQSWFELLVGEHLFSRVYLKNTLYKPSVNRKTRENTQDDLGVLFSVSTSYTINWRVVDEEKG